MEQTAMTPPNKPNSSPELTEVLRAVGRSFEREARRIGLLLPSGPDRDCYSFANTGLSNRDIRLAAILIPQALEALSSKNELPSFTCDMCDDPATCPAENCAFRSKETILSLQRRLDERDALLRDARHFITPCFSSGQALLVKIDAALNPKDTER
jgi:hypothetical protein